ncbi:MAG: hypothetical protein M1814_000259 [Vezdaea aestivalis]|nr:MAG: hypothetical protein M1814_000259 [Vezdaea aestivalis]
MLALIPLRKKGHAPIIAAIIILILITGFAHRRYNAPLQISTSTPYADSSNAGHSEDPTPSEVAQNVNKEELIIAAMKSSDMSWLDTHFPEKVANVYRVDDWFAELTVPKNKGREAMVFLTVFLGADTLSTGTIPYRKLAFSSTTSAINGITTIPITASFDVISPRFIKLTAPLDAVIMLQDLKLDYIKQVGYANLRCVWMWGCPNELEPGRYYRDRPNDVEHPTAMEFPDNFLQLFPNATMPEKVGIPCCSQFALSRDRIRERPRSDYVRYRRWLIDTDLIDATSGRIMEYSFHMMFGMPSEHCPDPRECYCKTYGYCNMTDDDVRNQWEWVGETLPQGWPAGVTRKKRPTDP